MNFITNFRNNIIKWWQLVIKPVLRINNNVKDSGRFASLENPETDLQVQEEHEELSADSSSDIKQDDRNNPMEVLQRIEREREEERLREIEEGRRAAQEKQQVEAIMNANKVDVNAFIVAGKAAIEEKQERESKVEASDEMDKKQQEELQRAQEIIERLNREAAEDEAKKQAEIEKARRQAAEKFS